MVSLDVKPCLVSVPGSDDGSAVGGGVGVHPLDDLDLFLRTDSLYVPTGLVGDTIICLKTRDTFFDQLDLTYN